MRSPSSFSEHVCVSAGDEFYMQEWPQLTGKRFGDVLLSFPDAVPIGIKKKEHVGVFLNPTDHYVIQPGIATCDSESWHVQSYADDEVTVLAEDDT